MADGFFDDLMRSAAVYDAIQASKDENGKPDPYKAAGLLAGMKGGLSGADWANLGAALGAQGAFDDPKDKDW